MRKDFERYFVECQKDYNRLLKQFEQINEEIKNGHVTEEQRAAFEQWFLNVKANYDRISYMRYLLRLPPKFIQRIQQKSLNAKMKKELEKYEAEHADKDSVLQENKEALDNIDEGLEECKNS